MREWTPPSLKRYVWVSLGSGDIVTSEVDLQDHEFKEKGTAARCVVQPPRVRTATQRVAAVASCSIRCFGSQRTRGLRCASGRVLLS
jgi:hypothetical protein